MTTAGFSALRGRVSMGVRLLLVLLCAAALAAQCGKGDKKKGGGRDFNNLPPMGGQQAQGGCPTSPSSWGRPDSFSGVINKIRNVVVTVSTKQIVAGKAYPGWPFGFMSPYDYPQKEQVRTGLGSGFIVDKSGLVVTNNHVIKDAAEIVVQLPDRRELPAGVIGKDARLDIAVLQIPEPVSEEAALGDSDKLEVGDWVIAIGNPMGLANTVTAGIVSARGRSSWDLFGEIPGYADFIQTDASINPGNSGGPLVDMGGEVVGVNTAIIKEGQGLGFAIPINMVKQILPQLVKEGRITRAWMGIYIGLVDAETAEQLRLKSPRGALVAQIVEGGPADQAGLRRGDVIVELGGKEIVEAGKLPWIIATSPIGAPVSVKVIRDGKELEFEVTLQPMPEEP
jgi:serine protease Do